MKAFFLVLAILLTFTGVAQNRGKWQKTTVIVGGGKDTATIKVDMANIDTQYVYEDELNRYDPQFPLGGSYDGIEKFINERLIVPSSVAECGCSISVPASINFDRKGYLTDIQLGYGGDNCTGAICDKARKDCEAEALRVLNLLPKQWDYKPRGRGKLYSLAWLVKFNIPD